MHNKSKRAFLALAINGALGAALLTGMAASPAQAQNYPNKTIKMIVPFAPGGSSDLLARIVAQGASKYLGKTIIVENKPGANTMTGLNEIISARPDGYTIGFAGSTMIFQPLYGNSRYEYIDKFQALAQVNETYPMLAVNAASEWKTIDELVAYAKANPGAIKYGVTGFGNTAHLGPAKLAMDAGVKMTPVSFDGGAPLIAALLGGHIAAGAGSPVDYKENIAAGKLRGLVLFSRERNKDPVLKDIPTAKEAGFDVEIVLWQGVFGPKGMPADVVAKLSDAFAKTLAEPEIQEKIRALGIEPIFLDADAYAAKWQADRDRMRDIVTKTGILDMVKSQSN
jgi:tripartite-type tricarboxylate transporter receptor subunit TctC